MIEHEGIVETVSGQQIRVKILAQSACAACHARGMCNLSELREKEITAQAPSWPVAPGDTVRVVAATGDAFFSVMMAYVIPSVLVIAALALFLFAGVSELAAAAASVSTLAGYFVLLYLLRHRLGRKIKFQIKEASPE